MNTVPKTQLTPKQVLEFIILGIEKGNYQAAIDIAKQCIEQLDEEPVNEKPDEHVIGRE